ncbi:DUF2970 family protein [Panacagrimonas perspica]|uniref:DUF2970 family protein n=1 Tax=Panacagrimonas perspica TaxID=381431 RepID=A0A4R7PAK2_9GAMM|nr:DUF2970 domain-containing protein [Panacagrimonas perspica]TDU31064.1 DUF2970 family protein [Panacagrimonas perspica]THD01794.1 hypothetical protein B1810_17455 [Panacagrimonas perspica]
MQTLTPASPQRPQPEERVGIIATIASVLSAFGGVQSSKARERDFSRGSPVLFFAVAVALTAGFALTLITVARIVVGRVAGAG